MGKYNQYFSFHNKKYILPFSENVQADILLPFVRRLEIVDWQAFSAK